jgi:hypothetical protein
VAETVPAAALAVPAWRTRGLRRPSDQGSSSGIWCFAHAGAATIYPVMCGRVRLSSDVSEIKLVFSIPVHRPTPNFAPTWNGAPTDQLPIVRFDPKAGERSLDLARWGLVPFWSKDIKVGFANINAKAEGIENRPAFCDAGMPRRRPRAASSPTPSR